MSFVVAIDGPAGSGKGTITKLVGEKLGLINIDTGAMYRSVTLKAIRENIGLEDIEKLEKMLEDISIEIKRNGSNQIIFLDGEDVSEEIRTPQIDSLVTKFAGIPSVRNKMTPLQREMGENSNIIMEGRDIGTAVFPNADVKIYLDASFEERAKRRYNQNIEKGIDCNYGEILAGIKERYELNIKREMNPLVKADDAIYIDTSDMTIQEVVEKIIEIIENKK